MKLPALPLAALLCLPCTASAGDVPSLAIRHDVFVTTDLAPGACESAQDRLITVEEDTPVQYCFRVQNLGDVTLTTHDLVTDAFGKLDSMRTLTLAPGETVNRSYLDLATDDRTTTSTWIARDVAPAYTPSPTAFEFTDIETTGTEIAVHTWEAQTITLPFPVRLYGRSSPYLSVCNLGMIQVDSFRGLCGMLPEPIPSGWELALMPFWARLDWFMGGVYTKTVGEEPHRRQIVQWRRAMESGGAPDGNGVTFQVVFTEEDDRIVFVYPDVMFGLPQSDAGRAAVIGVNYDANLGRMYSYFSPSLSNGQAILWTPNVWRTTQSSNSATVIVHSARAALAPRAIAARQAPGTVAERRVTIANTGRMPLDWHFGEAQTASIAHIPKHPRPAVASGAPVPERDGMPPEARLARRAAPPPLAPSPRGTKLPAGYGRDNGGEEFVKVDLSTGLVARINRVQDSPINAVDFRDADFTKLYTMLGRTPTALFTVDTDDGQRRDIGQSYALPQNREGWMGLTFDSTTGTMYASSAEIFVDYDGYVHCGPNAYLYRVNPDVGTPRLIGQIGSDMCLLDIATNANGELFGIDTNDDTLVAIDKTTGAGTTIGSLGVPITQNAGLDFDESANVLYLATWNSASMQSELRTVDTTTGASAFAAQFHRADGSFTYMVSLALESGGRGCTDPADVPWLTLVAPVSGTLAPDGETDVTVRVDATNLGEGRYEALLCLFSNDPRNRFVTLPVSLDVDADAVFRDGFD